MISPIQSVKSTAAPSQDLLRAFSPLRASTLQSLKAPSVISSFWQFFLSLFSGCFSPKSSSEECPEMNPRILPTGDVFRVSVFTKEGAIKREKAYKKVSELFFLLGTCSYSRLAFQSLSIWRREKEILGLKIPPLEFLYFLFLNKRNASYLVGFYKLPLYARKQFENRLASDLQKDAKRMESELPGFCKLLSLDLTKIQEFASKNDWTGAMRYILEKRKKHFSLS